MIVFPDALSVALRVLREAEVDELAPVKFGTRPPDELGDKFPGKPYVWLDLVGTDSSEHPFRERAEVQMTGYAESKARGLRLVQVCRAVLLAYAGDLDLGSARAGVGPFTAADPDTKEPIAVASVRLRLRPASL